MANFKTAYLRGQRGENRGYSMGQGLEHLSKAINGVQKGRIYTIAAAPKVGKSTLCDYAFLFSPYLEWLNGNRESPLEWIYFSFEMSRIEKEFDTTAFFLYHDHQITHVDLPKGVYYHGTSQVPLSSNLLRGRLQDDAGDIITLPKKVEDSMIDVYLKRVVPLFGSYDAEGVQTHGGMITFIEDRDNPTGLYKFLLAKAESEGTFIKRRFGKVERTVSYQAKEPDKTTIIITDHLRKLLLERTFQMKQTVDKYSEYTVMLKNLCNYTFVHIIHLNRSMSDERRMVSSGDILYPTSDDIKDTGNLSEDSDYVLTIFNPNDERYRLDKHFGLRIKSPNGSELYPYMRTIHLVESRHCEYPQHFRTNMHGGLKAFDTFVT